MRNVSTNVPLVQRAKKNAMQGTPPSRTWPLLVTLILAAVGLPHSQAQEPDALLQQSQTDADAKSAGCRTCHTATDSPTMNNTGTVRLG